MSEPMVEIPQKEKKKRPRASATKPRKTYLIAEAPSGTDLIVAEYRDSDGVAQHIELSAREAIVFKTKREKEAHRRLYRKEYATRPKTRERIAARLADPEVQRKRKEYAEREDVKKRKQRKAAEARAVRRKLKEEMPETYEELAERVKKELEETNKWLNQQSSCDGSNSDDSA